MILRKLNDLKLGGGTHDLLGLQNHAEWYLCLGEKVMTRLPMFLRNGGRVGWKVCR